MTDVNIIEKVLTCCVHPHTNLSLYNNICDQLVENGWKKLQFDYKKKYNWCSSSRYSKICGVDLDTYKYWQDKFYMYTMLKKQKYIPKTYIILNGKWIYRNKPLNDELFFVKKCNSDSAKGNHLFNKILDVEEYSKKNNFTYIVQPSIKTDTYQNKKYDIRIWGSLVSQNHISFDLVYYKYGKIRLANNEFEKDSLDPNIQMTNTVLKNESRIINFDETFPNFKDISIQINNIMTCLVKNTKNLFINTNKIKKKLIWNVGFDFIIDENKNCFLLEINNKPNYYKGDYSTDWYKYLAKNVYTPMELDTPPNFKVDNVVHLEV